MDKYKIKDLRVRLEKESFDNAHKMIYMWIKQSHINFKEYTELVKNLTIQHVSNSVCPECGYPKFKKSFENFERCHSCEWTSEGK